MWGIKKTPQKPQKVICLANYNFCGLLGVLGVLGLNLKNHVGVILSGVCGVVGLSDASHTQRDCKPFTGVFQHRWRPNE